MPAPAVYILAVVGTVAAGIAFKEFVYDPHIAPAIERWTDEFLAKRRERKRQRQLTSPISTPSASTFGLSASRYPDRGDDSEDDYGEPSDGEGETMRERGKSYELIQLGGNLKEREGLRKRIRKVGTLNESTDDLIKYPLIKPTPLSARSGSPQMAESSTAHTLVSASPSQTAGTPTNTISTISSTYTSQSASPPSSSPYIVPTTSLPSSVSAYHSPSPGTGPTAQALPASSASSLGWTSASVPAVQTLSPSPIRPAMLISQSPFLAPSQSPSPSPFGSRSPSLPQAQRTPLSLSITHPLDIDLELLSASSEASYTDADTHGRDLDVFSDFSDLRSDGGRDEMFSDYSDLGSDAGRGEVLFDGENVNFGGSELGVEGMQRASHVARRNGDVMWNDADGETLSESSWASARESVEGGRSRI